MARLNGRITTIEKKLQVNRNPPPVKGYEIVSPDDWDEVPPPSYEEQIEEIAGGRRLFLFLGDEVSPTSK